MTKNSKQKSGQENAILRILKKGLKPEFVAVFMGFYLVFLFWYCLPEKLFITPTSFVIDDRNGKLLAAAIASDGQWRFPHSDDIPDKFEQAILLFEDQRFYKHPGIDPLALGRAIIQNVRSGKIKSGASTISMQVIRLSRNKKRTYLQKASEAIQALRLELRYTKKEILALYASHAPFGGNVVGLEAASWRYFGRSPQSLTWGESAALAVLPNHPALVHPGRNREALLHKRNRLLDRLQEAGRMDTLTCLLAKLEPLPESPLPLPQIAPHLLFRFRKEYLKLREKEQATRLKTSVDARLQEQINSIVKRHSTRLRANGIRNIAALTLDIETGEALTYVGNTDLEEDPSLQSYVDIVTAPRSPGSLLKPLLYAAMLSEGALLPHTLLPDIPTQIGGYAPQNFDLHYVGAIPASQALARSLNIPFVRMLQEYKAQRFYELLKKGGITTLNRSVDHYGLSLILGGGEVSLWDICGLYASLARLLNHRSVYKQKYDPQDIHPPMYRLSKKKKPDLASFQIAPLLDPGAVWLTFNAMEDVTRPGDDMFWRSYLSSRRIAWKTGTSFGFRDGWALGLNSKYLTGVWVGNADGEGRPGLLGASVAGPILFEIFDILPAAPYFSKPDSSLTLIGICKQSGYKNSDFCTEVDSVWASYTGIRSGLCPWHRLVHLDKSGLYRVHSDCEQMEHMITESRFTLPPAMEFYYKPLHVSYRSLPPFKPGCVTTGRSSMELIYPGNGAKIYIPLEKDGARGKAVFNAAHRQPDIKLFWHLDEDFIGTTVNFHQIAIDAPAGKHQLTLLDEQGERIERTFEILEKSEVPAN